MLISWKVWTKFQQIKKKCIYEIPTHFLINQTEQKKLAHNYRDIKKELKKKRKEKKDLLYVCAMVRSGRSEVWLSWTMENWELRNWVSKTEAIDYRKESVFGFWEKTWKSVLGVMWERERERERETLWQRRTWVLGSSHVGFVIGFLICFFKNNII